MPLDGPSRRLYIQDVRRRLIVAPISCCHPILKSGTFRWNRGWVPASHRLEGDAMDWRSFGTMVTVIGSTRKQHYSCFDAFEANSLPLIDWPNQGAIAVVRRC